jgi:serine protease inhibitor
MRNLAITYSIAYAAALGLLLELPANAISKDKSKGKTKTQSRIWASPYGTSVWPHGKDKIIQPAGISKVVKESNHQALKLLADLTKSEKRDVVISPVASTAVYLLLLNGLRGDSRAKLAQAMKVDKTGEVLLANMTAAYLKSLSSTTPKCEVGVVGATNAPFSFQPQYSKLLKDKFGGLVLNDTQHQLNELRDYIKRKTAGQFGDTAQGPQPLSIDLYSTLHFNGEWSDKFQTAETHRADFYKVPTMCSTPCILFFRIRDCHSTNYWGS